MTNQRLSAACSKPRKIASAGLPPIPRENGQAFFAAAAAGDLAPGAGAPVWCISLKFTRRSSSIAILDRITDVESCRPIS